MIVGEQQEAPDIFCMILDEGYTYGLIDIYEVQSPSQTVEFMQNKINILSNVIGNNAGVVDFILRRIV